MKKFLVTLRALSTQGYVSENKVKLTVVNHDGTSNYEDVYTKHLQVGQFDLGFGSISGNSLDPLNFLEVLKSDNSSGFTLNWGPETSVVSENLIYEDQPWSFDSLWAAGDSFVIANEGVAVPLLTVLSSDVTKLSDGRLQVVIETVEMNTDDIAAFLYAICIYATNDGNYSDYTELYAYYDGTTDTDEEGLTSSWERVEGEGGAVTYTIVFDAVGVAYMEETFANFYTAGIDAYLYSSVDSLGIAPSVSFYTTFYVFDAWPTAEEPVPAPVILD